MFVLDIDGYRARVVFDSSWLVSGMKVVSHFSAVLTGQLLSEKNVNGVRLGQMNGCVNGLLIDGVQLPRIAKDDIGGVFDLHKIQWSVLDSERKLKKLGTELSLLRPSKKVAESGRQR